MALTKCEMPYRRSFQLLCIVAAFIVPAIAQVKPDGKKAAADPTINQDRREDFVMRWVDNYNKHGMPLVGAAFKELRPIPAGLDDRLKHAFPKHRFTLVDLRFYHHAWWDESYSLLQGEKSGRIIWFNPPIDPYNTAGLKPYTAFLSSYPAKNAKDAFFRFSALVEFLALVVDARIQQIQKNPGEFSFLICLNTYSIRDLGATLRVPYSRSFTFGSLYFERNEWERHKCSN